ncbi:MAG: membrane protein insertase YidC, partial [Bacteroidota bacterium]
MDKNTVIGFGAIFLLLLAISYINQPSKEELERQQFLRDSIEMEQLRIDSLAELEAKQIITDSIEQVQSLPDSLKNLQLAGEYGAFAPVASGEAQEVTLKNGDIEIVFSTKGGSIKKATLAGYERYEPGEKGEKPSRVPLTLLDNEKNTFEYILPVPRASARKVFTSDLYFQPRLNGNELIMRADLGDGKYIEQRYTLAVEGYEVDYDLKLVGLRNVLDREAGSIQLHWVDYLNRQEKSSLYEGMYSSAYFKKVDNNPEHCNCRKTDTETSETPVKWVAHTAQFFNASLIADEQFQAAEINTVQLGEEDPSLKKLESSLAIAYPGSDDVDFGMTFFIGPNKYDLLHAYDMQLEEIIPFGWSIFGWV